MTLLLSRRDLAALLSVPAVIGAVEQAFAAASAGRTDTPLRAAIHLPGTDGVVLVMPCAVADPPALGTKVVSVFRDNPARGLPTITSLYVLNDPQTGAPLAVIDGGYLTGIRTAAGSAVATRHLSRPDAQTLGVFGTGVQAHFHVLAICAVRQVRRVLVCGTSADKAAAFARWVTDTTGVAASAAAPPDVSGCDVLATCTTSPDPVVDDAGVRAGAHVNAIGAFTPATRELPAALVARAAVYVDARAGALAEAGDLLLPVAEGLFSLDRVRGEIGEVVLGTAAGRASPEEVTVYKSVGAAFLDAATARLAYMLATERGAGQEFAFS